VNLVRVDCLVVSSNRKPLGASTPFESAPQESGVARSHHRRARRILDLSFNLVQMKPWTWSSRSVATDATLAISVHVQSTQEPARGCRRFTVRDDFTRELVAIPSENPPGNEYARCAAAIAQKLKEVGLEPRVVEVPAARPGYCTTVHYFFCARRRLCRARFRITLSVSEGTGFLCKTVPSLTLRVIRRPVNMTLDNV